MKQPLILFDGLCGLCSAWVDFVIKIDRRKRYTFAALQSSAGQAILREHGLPLTYTDSVLLLDETTLRSHSTAVLHTLKGVGGPWSIAYAAIAVPPVFRDGVYRLVASSRYRWFGRRQTCRLPTVEERSRFIDSDLQVRSSRGVGSSKCVTNHN
jgi:predicted DCC family thiol-disulfide oxidoreductase YuxK